jgi:hypothetical protein
MIRRKFEMADQLEIFLRAPILEGSSKKPLRSIWGDVIAWLLVVLLVIAMPFVMFFVAISMGYMKIFDIADRNRPGSLAKSN